MGEKKRGDSYDAKIASEGETRYRDKLVSRSLAGLFGGASLFAFGLAGVGIALGVAAGLGFAFLGLTRTVLRTALTDTDLRVHWGMWGPTIPLSSIEEVSVREDCTRTAMNEVMRDPGSPRVRMVGPFSRPPVVDLVWTNEKGVKERLWLGAGDADGLAAAIRRAIAKDRARVRVEETEEEEQDEDVEEVERARKSSKARD
jgi:hypothetical protein